MNPPAPDPPADPTSTARAGDGTAVGRFAWALTGSGHYLRESLDLAESLGTVDLFLSDAAGEVLAAYGYALAELKRRFRVFRDNAASSPPVALLYEGTYHTVVVGPATSNTVAKCVAGISDSLATNMYAQAGKCRIESIVFACDTEPTVVTEAPGGMVTLYPRRIDLENTARLKTFEYTTVVETLDGLRQALAQRSRVIAGSAARWPASSS